MLALDHNDNTWGHGEVVIHKVVVLGDTETNAQVHMDVVLILMEVVLQILTGLPFVITE